MRRKGQGRKKKQVKEVVFTQHAPLAFDVPALTKKGKVTVWTR